MSISFEDLNLTTPIYNALKDLDFIEPTPIQAQVFSVIMSGIDVVGIAQTGTGKTFAYLLPLLRQLKFSESKHPRILIIVPTRELVLQVVKEIEKLTKYMTVRVAGVYGGTNIATQKQTVYNGLDVLVATAGRLYDLQLSGILRLNMIQKLVIDEVDEMLNLGFRPQLISFMETLPEKRQNMMFSATLTQDVEKIIDDFFYNPKKIEIAPHGTPLEKIEQKAYLVPNFYTKINLLTHMLSTDETTSRVLIFSGSKKLADRVFDQLEKTFPEQSGVIHSNKSQNFRLNSLNRFRTGENRILIATDIAARGIDISDVTHVINFDTPNEAPDYIHRIGRTGRADKSGIAITFINEMEQEYLMAIEALIQKRIPMFPIPENIEISTIFADEERPSIKQKIYIKSATFKGSKGAFHDKKDKNKQKNSGSPSKKRTTKGGASSGGRKRT